MIFHFLLISRFYRATSFFFPHDSNIEFTSSLLWWNDLSKSEELLYNSIWIYNFFCFIEDEDITFDIDWNEFVCIVYLHNKLGIFFRDDNHLQIPESNTHHFITYWIPRYTGFREHFRVSYSTCHSFFIEILKLLYVSFWNANSIRRTINTSTPIIFQNIIRDKYVNYYWSDQVQSFKWIELVHISKFTSMRNNKTDRSSKNISYRCIGSSIV